MKSGFINTTLNVLIMLLFLALGGSTPNLVYRSPLFSLKAEQVARNFRAIKVAFENWWNLERPTPIPSEIQVTSLVEQGYLSKVPHGFSDTIKIEKTETPEVYEITIVYVRGDVKGVERYYAEVKKESGVYVLRFPLQKWW